MLLATLPLTASAASLNINFSSAKYTADLAAGSSYGLVPIEANKWNQITICSAGGNTVLTETWPAPVALTDSNGELTGVTIETDARVIEREDAAAMWNGILCGAAYDYWEPPANSRLSTGSWPRIRLSNIPYERYRIYVYMLGTATSIPKNGPITITPEGGSESLFYYMDGSAVATSAMRVS